MMSSPSNATKKAPHYQLDKWGNITQQGYLQGAEAVHAMQNMTFRGKEDVDNSKLEIGQ